MKMIPTILCRLWLYQGSHEHSHSSCHAPMHTRLPSPHQANQHSTPSVGGQSGTRPISTENPPTPLPRTTFKPPPKMNAHSKDFPPSTSEQTARTVHRNAGYRRYSAFRDTSVHSV
jgi:hypothetical protein